MLLKHSRAVVTVTLVLLFGASAHAQLTKSAPTSKRDTVSVFGNQLKITLLAGAFEKIPGSAFRKYGGLFNLHDITSSSGFVLRAKDTLVFYLTTIDRPIENDGGISMWMIINSFLDKAPAYRMESGWNKLGRDYLYFVKLLANAKPDAFFEFNFFFIENKLAFSLLQRPIELGIIGQQSFSFVSTE